MDAIDSKYDSMSDFELVDELSQIANVKVPNAIEEIVQHLCCTIQLWMFRIMPAAVKNSSWKFENIKILLNVKKTSRKYIVKVLTFKN